jgi:hypothetical protein
MRWKGNAGRSEEMLDLRAQFIDFHLNLSHASQLNPELLVDVIDMALDLRRDLASPTSGSLALPTRGSCLTRGSSLARDSSLPLGPCRPPFTQWSFFAFPPGWSLDAAGTRRTRRTGNASWSSHTLTLSHWILPLPFSDSSQRSLRAFAVSARPFNQGRDPTFTWNASGRSPARRGLGMGWATGIEP